MFGYACDETPELMPLPITIAHRLAERLSEVRKDGTMAYLRPDGKTQVTIEYDGDRPVRVDTVVVSTQHAGDIDLDALLTPDVKKHVVDEVLATFDIDSSDYRLLVNPTGRFEIGGPMGDAGLTGRKIIIDTYGGMARHGGGAFSGKDPSKVDRSARVRDALGRQERRRRRARPPLRGAGRLRHRQGAPGRPLRRVLRHRDGAGRHDPRRPCCEVFDLRPAAIIRDLDLLRPIYAQTAAYGHFGRELPDFTWERTDRVDGAAGRRRRLTADVARCRAHASPASVRWLTRAGHDVTGRATPQAAEQLALLERQVRAGVPEAAGRRRLPTQPVARVAVDLPLAHLDRPFDYLVPAVLHERRGARLPGQGPLRRPRRRRVRPRAGRRHRARRCARPAAPGRVRRAGADSGRCCAAAAPVADRYAGTLADVLRLAVPPRHARVEARGAARRARRSTRRSPTLTERWAAEAGGRRLPATGWSRARRPRAVWTALPGADWAGQLAAAAAAATRPPGAAACICVPDARDVARVDRRAHRRCSGPDASSC